MAIPKKWIPILSFLTVGFFAWLFIPLPTITWQAPIGTDSDSQPQRTDATMQQEPTLEHDRQMNLRPAANMPFQPGAVKPVGEPYTKTLVVPRTKKENVDWIAENFERDKYIDYKIYTVDDVDALLHPPKNKGHEVMVYLTYIVDHYHNLSDVNIFMHSHRLAWHNNEILDHDAVQIVSRLSSERVQREGYMNMRCHWDPGCPGWMKPGTIEEDINKQEETMLAKSWSELFPLDPVPNLLAQACCAQFAVSRDRIRSLPLARYVFYRDWLLRTSMSDYLSGRVWEYVWQFVFTGQNIVCPKEHICYCDGFGVCFGGEVEYENYAEKVKDRYRHEDELRAWTELNTKWQDGNQESGQPEAGKDIELKEKIDANNEWCDRKKERAKRHGDVAMNRAKEAGRVWRDGDGF